MKLPWILPLGLITLVSACGRSRHPEEWELAADVRLTQIHRSVATDPESPRRLEVREPGSAPAGAPLVFVQDGPFWRLLDPEARVVFSTPVPVNDEDPQPSRGAAAFFSSARRTVFLLHRRALLAIPIDTPTLRTIATVGSNPLCAFHAPFEQHVLQEDDFWEDPDRRLVCVVLRDAPEPDTRRTCMIAVNPRDGALKSTCTRDAGRRTGRPVEPPHCVVSKPVTHAPTDPGWTANEAACTLAETSGGRTIPLSPGEEEPSPCRVRFEGRAAGGRFGIWCTADPEGEYVAGRCQVIDLERARPLEPAVDLPWENPVRWDSRARAALVGDNLFLLDASPVRWVTLNSTALFVR